jgi:hypothetical protein
VGTWHDLDVGRPIAAPLEQCAELLGVDLATVRELAAKVELYLRADGTSIWSLMRLERQLRPEAYGRRRGGYLDRRQAPAPDASPIRRRNCSGLDRRAAAGLTVGWLLVWLCRVAHGQAGLTAWCPGGPDLVPRP